MREVALLALLLVIACCPAAADPVPTTEAERPSVTPTPTWARTEALGVVHVWLSEQTIGEDTCLLAYSRHRWTVDYTERGTWVVTATPKEHGWDGRWAVYEGTASIARGNENIPGC